MTNWKMRKENKIMWKKRQPDSCGVKYSVNYPCICGFRCWTMLFNAYLDYISLILILNRYLINGACMTHQTIANRRFDAYLIPKFEVLRLYYQLPSDTTWQFNCFFCCIHLLIFILHVSHERSPFEISSTGFSECFATGSRICELPCVFELMVVFRLKSSDSLSFGIFTAHFSDSSLSHKQKMENNWSRENNFQCESEARKNNVAGEKPQKSVLKLVGIATSSLTSRQSKILICIEVLYKCPWFIIFSVCGV